MKNKRLIGILCIVACVCLLLCGCEKTTEPSVTGDNGTSAEQGNGTGNAESGNTDVSGLGTHSLGGMNVADLADKRFMLTPNNFHEFFHYRIESVDRGGEYDVLSYSLAMNASFADISPLVEGLPSVMSFNVTIRYAKEYTENGLVYDTLTYPCSIQVSGSGTVDIPEIPVFKRSETDTEHKKFTVMSVTPNLDTVAGVVDYSYTGHTYREEVTFDTVPGFEAVAHGDCIAVYMAPENNDCLYDGLSVDIEVRYTYDSTDKADRFITYYPINITIDGNLGGYGQCLIPITSGDKKITKVVVSVVDVSGYVIKSKGLYAFDYTK